MKIKKEYIVLSVIIVSLVLYLILHNPDRTLYDLPKTPDVEKKKISKIEIKKQDVSILLNKKTDQWQIAPHGYLADTGKINNMLDVIAGFTLTALISESKNYHRYDLDPDNKITIRAWAGKILKREFEVGKTAASYKHTYVKLADDDHVYHARGNFKNNFDLSVEKLRDKKVLSFEKNEIREIRITKDKKVMIFSQKDIPLSPGPDKEKGTMSKEPKKTETVWQTADGKKGDKAKINRLITSLSSLTCKNYINDNKKEDFKDPIYSVLLKGANEYSLMIFPQKGKDEKTYPAVSSENNYPFVLSASQADRIMNNPDNMLLKPDQSKPSVRE